jgi:MFS family permease
MGPTMNTHRTTATAGASVDRAARAAAAATFVAFVASGVAFASWASRIPQIRDRLHLSPSALGLVLLSLSIGSMAALPLAGSVVARFGARRTTGVAAVLFSAGLATLAVGSLVGVAPVVAGLVVVGASMAVWDVAMNVHGTALEHRLGRSLLPRLHAGFSVGSVAGALAGTAMVAWHVPVAAHLTVVAAVMAVAVPITVRRFVATHDRPQRESRVVLARWRERRTLLIGLFVLAFTFAEGAGTNWIGVAAIDGHGASAPIATLAYAAFLAAMTTGRWFGPPLIERYGRVPVMRALTVTGCAGAALFVVAPAVPLAVVGAVLWGAGNALGFPVGMSAAGDDPPAAAGRISVVSTIGYTGFLVGAPALGLLGQHMTVLRALIAVAVLLAMAALTAAGVAPSRAP